MSIIKESKIYGNQKLGEYYLRLCYVQAFDEKEILFKDSGVPLKNYLKKTQIKRSSRNAWDNALESIGAISIDKFTKKDIIELKESWNKSFKKLAGTETCVSFNKFKNEQRAHLNKIAKTKLERSPYLAYPSKYSSKIQKKKYDIDEDTVFAYHLTYYLHYIETNPFKVLERIKGLFGDIALKSVLLGLVIIVNAEIIKRQGRPLVEFPKD